MDKPFIEIDAEHFTLSTFEVEPIEGYEIPKNKITGQVFPNCCAHHKDLYAEVKKWFDKFPDCCKPHKAMVGKWWFNKNNYSGLPDKILKQISFTLYHIAKQLEIENWYKDITDYIECNMHSFGHPAIGANLYLGNIKNFLENNKEIEIPKEKRDKLIEFINRYYAKEDIPRTDLNILITTYQKWLKTFPFEISYFSEIKEQFEKQIPILDGKPEVNIYSGIVKARMHTKSSLIEALINITNNLLTQINGVTLYEKGLISDANKIKLELITNSRKLKLQQGYKNNSPNEEQRYRKILKEWFNDEKTYFKELTTVLKEIKRSTDHKEQEHNHNFSILTIDEAFSRSDAIPFEIKFIYEKSYSDSQRFIKVTGENCIFFTETNTYNIFKEAFRDGELFTDDLQPLSLENVQPYYEAYAAGFLKGYRQFDEKLKSSTAIFQSDIQSTVKKVFDYINVRIEGLASYGCGWINEKRVQTIRKDIWLEAGIKAGEKYKAWFFVISNYSYFIDLFRAHKPYIDLYISGAKFWKEEQGGDGLYSHLIKLLTEMGETGVGELNPEYEDNDFLQSTIEDHLFEFKDAFTDDTEYSKVIEIIKSFFTGTLLKSKKEVFVKNGYKKHLASALGQIYKTQKNETISLNYLQFAKDNFSIFKDEDIQNKELNKTNLYKYLTSKT
jgi:hypothetical protein